MLPLILLTYALSTPAHQVGLSRGLYTQSADGVELELVLARGEAVEPQAIVDGIHVSTAGPCVGTVQGTSPTEEDGWAARVRFACPSGPARVDFALLERLSPGHKHLAHVVTAEGEQDFVVQRGSESFAFGAAPSRWAMVGVGVEHILLGFDHLVFLFALVVVGGSLRSLVAIVSAFTLAHSLTLALAVLGVVAPPPEVIEPLIALSIAYVGVENFFVTSTRGRWRVTAPFGLVHGFGFAGALGEVGVPRDDVAMTLFAFNVGVEAGQLLVLAVFLPLTLIPGIKKPASVVVVVLGLFWFVERLLS